MYRVLIAEDDPMVAMINEQYVIRNKSFEVVGHCRDGLGTLEFLETHRVDLIILDVFMPRMDGFETLRQIRSRKLPVDVIMVTAANGREALEEALHLGIVDYLVKPFTFERFQSALGKFAAQSAAMRTLDTLDQQSIDSIVDSMRHHDDAPQKGIQEKTLRLICEQLRRRPDARVTGEELAAEVGLTVVTVRRYLNYLASTGQISGELDYETGGRPCMRYWIK